MKVTFRELLLFSIEAWSKSFFLQAEILYREVAWLSKRK